MIKHRKPMKFLSRSLVASVMVAGVLAAGCSNTRDHVEPPTKLVDVRGEFAPRIVWSASTGSAQPGKLLRLVPYVEGGVAYTVDPAGKLTAVDLDSGATRWARSLDVKATAGLGGGEGLLVLATEDGELIAVERETGEVRWRKPLTTLAWARPAVAGGKVIVRTGDGRVFAFDAVKGTRLWVEARSVPALSLQGQSDPVVLGNEAVLIGYDNGALVVHALADGRSLWETQVALPSGRSDIDRMVDIDATPLVDRGVVYALSYQGRLAAVELRSGQPLWNREMSGYSSMTADSGTVYFSDARGAVWAVDKAGGQPLWRQEALLHRALSAPVLAGRWLVVGDLEGYVHFLSPDDGHIVARTRVDGGRVVGQPVPTRQGVLVLTEGGRLTLVAVPD
ncbi:MAG: outer membrane protein assembly factor BamB [Halothiobacillaceae bacterium]|nr:outer membrane protein assembly factor BamB [Halothiobacillaceae bacterium]MDY0049130.1 outer membrane protein assembly factor BamB [Halothiobacillaceae bacterium]